MNSWCPRSSWTSFRFRPRITSQAKLPLLATYMGHVSIVSTAYDLAFVEPVRALANARFARRYGAFVRSRADISGRPVVALNVPDLTVAHIVAFLHHIEKQRHVTATTRIEYDEIAAVLAGVDRSTEAGRRDYALVATMFNTGARVQEILDLRARDLQLTKPYQLRLVGKERKVRWCPLWSQTARLLRARCIERQLDLRSDAPVFVNHRGLPLSRFGVRFILGKHVRQAAQHQPGLATKKLHPHSLRHSTAVHLLKSGVDLVTIAHWLGHASVNTTNRYVTVDLELKRKAPARAAPLGTSRSAPASWRRDASVLE